MWGCRLLVLAMNQRRRVKPSALGAMRRWSDGVVRFGIVDAKQALFSIARDDSDKDMRGKALFWLAQKHDPRVTKLISDLILNASTARWIYGICTISSLGASLRFAL